LIVGSKSDDQDFKLNILDFRKNNFAFKGHLCTNFYECNISTSVNQFSMHDCVNRAVVKLYHLIKITRFTFWIYILNQFPKVRM